MTVYKALLIDIASNVYGSIYCTFCQNRDRFTLPIPLETVENIEEGQYYDIDFDIIDGQFGNNLSFNFINPAKDNSHD